VTVAAGFAAGCDTAGFDTAAGLDFVGTGSGRGELDDELGAASGPDGDCAAAGAAVANAATTTTATPRTSDSPP
jgi:hypothetical protein